MSQKVYVGVLVDHDPKGRILHKVITWEDGTRYVIDMVVDIRQAASRVGGQGDRYTIRVLGLLREKHQPDGQRHRPLVRGKTHHRIIEQRH